MKAVKFSVSIKPELIGALTQMHPDLSRSAAISLAVARYAAAMRAARRRLPKLPSLSEYLARVGVAHCADDRIVRAVAKDAFPEVGEEVDALSECEIFSLTISSLPPEDNNDGE